MQTSALFGYVKIIGFFEIYGVSARTNGGRGCWARVNILQTRGGGSQFFVILCRCLLWMVP